jgi:protein TonB
MFEDSTFESSGRIRTRSRRWMIAALALNGSIVATLILIPLIYPDALPRLGPMILMEMPPRPPADQPRPPKQTQPQFHGTSEMSVTSIMAPPRIPTLIPNFKDDGPPPGDNLAEMSDGPGVPGGIDKAFHGHEAAPVVRAAPKGPTAVSSGVMAGQLVYKVTPVYPAMGLAVRVEGTVVLQAVISKAGTIENLRVVSGPPMLQMAAMDAVKQWRYKPYQLDGQAVEVETTVNVVFRLGR